MKGGGAAPSREECQSQACFRQAENAQGRASPATERQPTIVAASSGSLGLSLSGVIRPCSNGWAGPLVWYSTKLESPASRQNPLQRAAMHLETPRSFRHVVCARFVNLLYVLPAHLSRRHRTRWRLSSHAFRREQDRNNIVHVRRFGEIVHGTEFDCPDCGGDISVAGQDDGVASGCRSLSAEITSNPHPSPNLRSTTAYSGARRFI